MSNGTNNQSHFLAEFQPDGQPLGQEQELPVPMNIPTTQPYQSVQELINDSQTLSLNITNNPVVISVSDVAQPAEIQASPITLSSLLSAHNPEINNMASISTEASSTQQNYDEQLTPMEVLTTSSEMTDGGIANDSNSDFLIQLQKGSTETAHQTYDLFTDNMLWCHDCGKSIRGLCRKHGGFSIVKDRIIPSRARQTTPHLINIKTIELRAGKENVFGAFAKKVIQKRSQFGPFEAKSLDAWTYKGKDRLKLARILPSGELEFLDCEDQEKSNWMIFVRPAETAEQQNVVAFQYRTQIYFVSTRAIAPSEELRVWYSKDYGKIIGMPVLEDLGSVSIEVPQTVAEESTKKVQKLSKEKVEMDIEAGNVGDDAIMDCIEGEIFSQIPVSAMEGSKVIEIVPKNEDAENQDLTYCSDCEESFENQLLWSEHICMDDRSGRRARQKRRRRPSRVVAEAAVSAKLQRQNKKIKSEKGENSLGDIEEEDKKSLSGVVKKKLRAPKKLFSCDHCSSAFSTENKLSTHRIIHTGEKPFVCTDQKCGKAFSSKFKMTRHMLIHDTLKRHHCPYCQHSFSRRDHLKNHLKIHDPHKKMMKCPKCDKEYASRFAFKTHKAFHAAEEGDLQCMVCLTPFEHKEELLRHLKIHAGARSIKDASEKNQNCPFCNKSFYTRKDVKRHLVVHTKDRDFLCQHCPQRFGRRDHLVRHLKKAHSLEATLDDQLELDLAKIRNKNRRPGQAAKSELNVQEESEDGTNQMVSQLLQAVARNMVDNQNQPSQTIVQDATQQRIVLPIDEGSLKVKTDTVHYVQSSAANTNQNQTFFNIGGSVISQDALRQLTVVPSKEPDQNFTQLASPSYITEKDLLSSGIVLEQQPNQNVTGDIINAGNKAAQTFSSYAVDPTQAGNKLTLLSTTNTSNGPLLLYRTVLPLPTTATTTTPQSTN